MDDSFISRQYQNDSDDLVAAEDRDEEKAQSEEYEGVEYDPNNKPDKYHYLCLFGWSNNPQSQIDDDMQKQKECSWEHGGPEEENGDE